MVVQVRLSVAVETVGVAHDSLPATRQVDVATFAPVPYDQGVAFEVVDRRAH
jgi:hypothetical protein